MISKLLRGQLYIVGMGPGSLDGMTISAKAALDLCDVIVGYTVYIDLLRPYFPDKEYLTTPMKKEVERCEMCIELAKQGRRVAMVCSGDAGVYGMAAPVYELIEKSQVGCDFDVEVVPGVTAANSGAAVLGAPLNHDYCVISLSDLLTPWEIIEKRLRAAVAGDFAIAIYNPSSHKRADYLQRACDILLDAGASPKRACGYVENIGRANTSHRVCRLDELRNAEVNMFTTVFVGNSMSKICGDVLITSRGYVFDSID